MLSFAMVTASLSPQAQANLVQEAGASYPVADEIVVVGIVVALIAAMFLLDKFSWSFMTGGRNKR